MNTFILNFDLLILIVIIGYSVKMFEMGYMRVSTYHQVRFFNSCKIVRECKKCKIASCENLTNEKLLRSCEFGMPVIFYPYTKRVD